MKKGITKQSKHQDCPEKKEERYKERNSSIGQMRSVMALAIRVIE
jgi:hypothetical protein